MPRTDRRRAEVAAQAGLSCPCGAIHLLPPCGEAENSFDIQCAAARVCREYEVLAGKLLVKSFNVLQLPAGRYNLLKSSALSANTTPRIRTEEFYIPKVRQTFFFFTDQTAIFLLMFQKKNGGLNPAPGRAQSVPASAQ
jgi:hypothetical protein